MCNNRKLLEDAMHFRFREKRYDDRHDWFVVDFEELRNALDYLQIGLDGVASSFTIDQDAINDALNAARNYEPDGSDKSITYSSVEDNDGDLADHDDADVDEEILPVPDDSSGMGDEASVSKEPLPPPTPTNFARFLEECYDKDPDSKACWVEIGARCRLWLRSTQLFKEELAAFLKANGHKETYIFDAETKTNYTAYTGLKMKPLQPFKVTKSSSEIERFVYDMCIPNATGRVTCKDLASAYETWKKDKLTKQTKKLLNEFFNKNFLASTVHDGARIRYGFYGVSLKGSEAVGLKMKKKNRQVVDQLDAETMTVIKTYDSITHAAVEMGVSISLISTAISGKKVYKGYKFQKRLERILLEDDYVHNT
jgi:regulator of sigma D